MLVAGSVSFVSCSDDDEEETTQTVEVKTTTRTVTIGDNTYTYTTVGGEVSTSGTVKVNSDGSVTVSATDGSSVTFSADGNTITYKTADNKTYTGSTSSTGSDSGSMELTSESGEKVTAEVKTETKTEIKTETTSGSETSLSGNTYVAYTLSESKAQIHAIAFSNGSAKFVKLTSKNDKDNEFDPETGSYTVSGSKILVDGEECAVINSNGTFTDKEDRTFEKYTGDVYAYTYYSDSDSKTKVEIISVGSDGKGYVLEDKIEKGSATGKEVVDLTYTKNGNEITFFDGWETVKGTISTGTQSGFSVEKLSLSFEEGDYREYIKLNGSTSKTQTTSSVSEATASVTELAYDSDTLNNKVFSYEDEDDGVRYLIFTGGKCYKSTSADYIGWEADDLLISYNNKIYRSDKSTRSSGSGLFATFDDGEGCKCTLNSDGTGSIDFYEYSSSFSCTFTNNAGFVTISFTDEGGTKTGAWYYNGENLYDLKEELTFVKNYSAN